MQYIPYDKKMESGSVLDDRKMRTTADRRKLRTPDFCCCDMSRENASLLEGRLNLPNSLARRSCVGAENFFPGRDGEWQHVSSRGWS